MSVESTALAIEQAEPASGLGDRVLRLRPVRRTSHGGRGNTSWVFEVFEFDPGAEQHWVPLSCTDAESVDVDQEPEFLIVLGDDGSVVRTEPAHATTAVAACTAEQPAAPRAALSRRELHVLQLLADGLDVSQVSIRLGLSVHTTRAYVKSVLRKFGVATQLQAVLIAIREGLVEVRASSTA